jgi:hypothetical protein
MLLFYNSIGIGILLVSFSLPIIPNLHIPTSQRASNIMQEPFVTNTSSTETMMKNYQQHVENLQRKLHITTDICTEQELNYKSGIEDMELNFRRILSQRDDFIKLR